MDEVTRAVGSPRSRSRMRCGAASRGSSGRLSPAWTFSAWRPGRSRRPAGRSSRSSLAGRSRRRPCARFHGPRPGPQAAARAWAAA